MSAICGVLDRSAPPIEATGLAAVEAAMPYYDSAASSRFEARGTLTVAHLTHLGEEQAPPAGVLRDERSGRVVVASARLDNRNELAEALSVPAAEAKSYLDTRWILLAFDRWGEKCAGHLLGDFAFVVWDPATSRVFAARDHLGIEPFFYHQYGPLLVFASQLAAVLAHPGVQPRIDDVAVREVLVHGDIPGHTHTLFENVQRLAPGHYMSCSEEGLKLHRYWSPADAPAIELPSLDQYCEALREQLSSAVSCRTGAGDTVGAHLSGGLDSSTLAVLADRHLRGEGRRLKAYSWAPPPSVLGNLAGDERDLVRAVCEAEDLECVHTALDATTGREFRDRNFGFEPIESLLWEQAVQQRAAADGCRVLLSGWGGDEVISFNGRGYLAELFLTGAWRTLTRELVSKSRLDHNGPFRRLYGTFGLFIRRVVEPFLPDLVLDWVDPSSIVRSSRYFVAPDFERRLRSTPYLPRTRIRERPGVRRNQLDQLGTGHLQRRIEDWHASAARHRFSYRYPLLDKRVVEFGLGLPPRLFFHNGWKRYLFREATQGVLPDVVRWNKTKREPALVGATIKLGRAVRAESSEADAVGLSSPYVDTERLARVLGGQESFSPSARRHPQMVRRARAIARLGDSDPQGSGLL